MLPTGRAGRLERLWRMGGNVSRRANPLLVLEVSLIMNRSCHDVVLLYKLRSP